jgi:hypothetical protein
LHASNGETVDETPFLSGRRGSPNRIMFSARLARTHLERPVIREANLAIALGNNRKCMLSPPRGGDACYR